MSRCIIVFAKEPELGRVKTRLEPIIGKEKCQELYKLFIEEIICKVNEIDVDLRVLAYEAYQIRPRYLKNMAQGYHFFKQIGQDLGQKMSNTVEHIKRINIRKIVIIGTDSPNLPIKFIENAFDALNDNDVVFGPTDDGGYYLLGIKQYHNQLFEGIEWSTDKVLQQSIDKCMELNFKWHCLEKWYDVDTQKDLERLKNDLDENDSYCKKIKDLINSILC